MSAVDPLSREAVMGLARLMRMEGWEQTADRIEMLYEEVERLRNATRPPRPIGELLAEDEAQKEVRNRMNGNWQVVEATPAKPKRVRKRSRARKALAVAGVVPYAGLE